MPMGASSANVQEAAGYIGSGVERKVWAGGPQWEDQHNEVFRT